MKKVLVVLMVLAVMAVASLSEATQASVITTLAKELFGQGYFQPGDTYKIAFFTSSRTCDATETAYSTTNEIATSGNYTQGGWSLSGYTWTTSGTTAFADFTDVSQSNITFSAASTCALIYDSTSHAASCTGSGAPWACCTGSGTGCAGTAVMFTLTFTSIQPSAQTLTVTWPAADASNAIVRIQ